MTAEPDQEFMYVPHAEVEAREAEGWRVCKGWRNMGHHLRYTLPMVRDLPGGGDGRKSE